MANCDCTDRGCRFHRGFAWCTTLADEIVYRVDMEDLTGTLMCSPCAGDAYETGLFTSEAPTLEFADA